MEFCVGIGTKMSGIIIIIVIIITISKLFTVFFIKFLNFDGKKRFQNQLYM